MVKGELSKESENLCPGSSAALNLLRLGAVGEPRAYVPICEMDVASPLQHLGVQRVQGGLGRMGTHTWKSGCPSHTFLGALSRRR